MIKKRTKLAFIFCLIFAFSLLLFNVVLNKAENNNISNTLISNEELNNNSGSEDPFGKAAYSYVEFFQDNLSRRLAGSLIEKETADYIQSELKKAGYTQENIELQTFEYIKEDNKYYSQNVIITKKGTDEKEIVVGAHYDSVKTHGVDDNGSGVAVVLATAARLNKEEVPYTVKFVFFGAEEKGRKGSNYYVDSLSEEERKNTVLMINLDCILAGDKEYVFGGTVQKDGSVKDTWAVEQAIRSADELGLDMNLNPDTNPKMKSPSIGDYSDHVPFKNKGIPYVYFGAGNWDLPPYDPFRQTVELGQIMHTKNDDLDVINEHFEGRALERLTDYSKLLNHVLKNIHLPESD